MNRLLYLSLAMALPLLSQSQEETARQFVELLAKQDFTHAAEFVDDSVKSAMSAATIEQAWNVATAQFGAFSKQTGVRTEKLGPYDVVYVDSQFEKTPMAIKVVVTKTHKVAGFSYVPVYAAVELKIPNTIHEQPLAVSDLPGTLTLPNGTGPFPAVVLVHGSGPNDRDEHIGPNKPFRDLAWGLAARGIAVLRYDKRTKVHPEQFGPKATVKDETSDDALAAVSLLRATARIDAKRIFVLGHSLGGMLLPRIAKADPTIAGLIAMAAANTPLEEAIVAQMEYLNAPGLEEVRTKAGGIKDLTATSGPVLGLPASYWLDLRGYHPAESAKQLKQPMLILQGERDYQVTMKDFAAWKAALGSRPDVAFKSYPALNHLFLPGEGKSLPAEYDKPGRFPDAVVEDIANWIKRH